jgi:hypothetical protein
MTDRLRVEEVAEVLVGHVADSVDDPIDESPSSPRVFGLPEFAFSERIKPRFALLIEDGPPSAILRRKDVVIGLAGQHVGDSVIVGRRFDKAVLGRDCAAIRVTVDDRDRVLPEWLNAWTRTQDFQRQVEREVVGATIQRLTQRGLRGLLIPVFPLKEQERMAAIAEAFDAALDAARLTVSDLEELRDRQLDLELYQRLEDLASDEIPVQRASTTGSLHKETDTPEAAQ